VSDFTETLAQIYEQHAEALQLLVSNFRKKNAELRKERPACQSSLFYAWETFLQEIEADSQATTDVASALSRQVRTNRMSKFNKIKNMCCVSAIELPMNMNKLKWLKIEL
jgi:SH3 and cysteine-rich domain-containing protein 2